MAKKILFQYCFNLGFFNLVFLQVTGDSLYNLLNFSEVETDKDDRPVESPPKLISVEVCYFLFTLQLSIVVTCIVAVVFRDLCSLTHTHTDTQTCLTKKILIIV